MTVGINSRDAFWLQKEEKKDWRFSMLAHYVTEEGEGRGGVGFD